MIRQEGVRGAWSWLVISVLGAVVLTATLAVETVSRDTFSPEIGLAYLTLSDVKTLNEALSKFLSFHETWYRPLTFYLTNYLLFQLVDFHDIIQIKAVAFCVIVLNAAVAAYLGRRLFRSGLVESALTFSLIVSHPLYYAIAFEGSGIVDPIFTIFLNLFLIFYLALLETLNPRIGPSTKFTAVTVSFLFVLCCVFILGTITSHERGLAIFPMIGLLFVYYHLPHRQHRRVRWGISEIGVVAFCAIVFLTYMALVYASKGQWSGQHYRTGIDFQYIWPNVVKAIELPLRLLLMKTGSVYDGHWSIEFNLYAFPLIACLAICVWQIWRRPDELERQRFIILAILTICALPIPVLFGSSAWHFYTAAIYVSIATGRAIWSCLRKMNHLLGSGLLIAIFATLSVATVRGVGEELRPASDYLNFMSLVPRALKDNTLHDIVEVPEVVYYDTGDYGELTWPFGGQGNLFKYLYRDPHIIEIAIVNGKVLSTDLPRCSQAAGKRALSFRFDVKQQSWAANNAKPCPP